MCSKVRCRIFSGLQVWAAEQSGKVLYLDHGVPCQERAALPALAQQEGREWYRCDGMAVMHVMTGHVSYCTYSDSTPSPLLLSLVLIYSSY